MNADYTHITYVIDSSTSMGSVWPATISGLKEFVLSQKAEKGKCTLSLINFDTRVQTPLDFVDIQLVTENIEEYKIFPSGCTALYDAVGKAIVDTGLKLSALPESDRPSKVVIVVQTDGEENSSREYKAAQIAEMLAEQRDKYNWQFMFVGASESSVTTATQQLGFAAASVGHYDVSNTKGYHGVMNSKLSSLRSAKSLADVTLATTYSDFERSAMK
jgi:uncharacterized protein YegL